MLLIRLLQLWVKIRISQCQGRGQDHEIRVFIVNHRGRDRDGRDLGQDHANIEVGHVVDDRAVEDQDRGQGQDRKVNGIVEGPKADRDRGQEININGHIDVDVVIVLIA